MIRQKTHRAAALKYDSETDSAPKVVASGQGETGKRILDLANEHGIPIHQDPALVETLLALELGQEIPSELYQVVAEVFVFVHELERKESGKRR